MFCTNMLYTHYNTLYITNLEANFTYIHIELIQFFLIFRTGNLQQGNQSKDLSLLHLTEAFPSWHRVEVMTLASLALLIYQYRYFK